MNTTTKYLIVLFVGMLLGVLGCKWTDALTEEAERRAVEEMLVEEFNDEDSISIRWKQNHFILNEENLYHELVAQDVDFPEIVLAQAILETGHFKSYSCVQRNNLFGLRSGKGSYMAFDHWTLAVAAYKKYIQKYNSPPKDYYKYLNTLGYANDPNYTVKLKELVNKK